MTTPSTDDAFTGWVILELMGHRRLAGHLIEQEIAGASFLRLDIPSGDGGGTTATQYYAPQAVYAITPTTEDTARLAARRSQPAPVSRWELELPPAPATGGDYEGPF